MKKFCVEKYCYIQRQIEKSIYKSSLKGIISFI